jgi:hypothetical protein
MKHTQRPCFLRSSTCVLAYNSLSWGRRSRSHVLDRKSLVPFVGRQNRAQLVEIDAGILPIARAVA